MLNRRGTQPARAAGPRYKCWVVLMLWAICFFNYADRQAVFSVFPLLEREMHLKTVQLGLLGSAFAWVYGLGAPLAGTIVSWSRNEAPRIEGVRRGSDPFRTKRGLTPV